MKINKYLFYFIVVVVTELLLSCKKTDQSSRQGVEEEKDAAHRILVVSSRLMADQTQVRYLVAYDGAGNQVWEREGVGMENNRRLFSYEKGVLFAATSVFNFINGGPNYEAYQKMNAIDIENGQDKWSVISPDEMVVSIFVDKGILYASLGKHNVHYLAAYRCDTGQLLWKYATNYSFPITTIIVEGNVLYFTTSTSTIVSNLFAFDLSTRTIKWNKPLGINVISGYSRPVLAGLYIYIRTGTGVLLALDKETGTEIWNKAGMGNAVPVFKGKDIYLATESGVSSIDVSTGVQNWVWYVDNSWFKGGNPYIINNHGFAAGGDSQGGFVGCFNREDGSTIWRKKQRRTSLYPVVVGDDLYVYQWAELAHEKDILMRLDRKTGASIDSINLTGLTNDKAIIVGKSGNVYSSN